MVALSILFSYGLQFCVPSEIVWSRLEPWLRNRRQFYTNGKPTSNPAVVSTIASSTTTMTTTTAVSVTSNNLSINEKKQLELELAHQEKPMDGAYYVMRAIMILGTGIVPISILCRRVNRPASQGAVTIVGNITFLSFSVLR